ncbi:MAG: LPS export ABC transporter periplasmic protein LptC [Erythrobacter sp.]|nr:LPS export ABC transporter periplasmic protein LptC [Erythrobacter sp.]NCQ62503.1 LPS export ABC transporter periplasmic protein LptC [Alphaproteobacteria bacterium]
MHHDHVEETSEAQRQRRGRQKQAAPGGFHDRLIKTLAIALPMATGAIVAFLVIAPFSPRSEVSFILDRDKVEQIDERLRVDNATYRGSDNEGRPFSVLAEEAVQKSSAEGIVRLQEVVARILLADGPAQIAAEGGDYTIADELLKVRGPVMLRAADGYRLVARGVSVNLRDQTLVGSEGVSGAVPAGTFSADSLRVDLDERTITLDGNARLRMVPGALETMQ